MTSSITSPVKPAGLGNAGNALLFYKQMCFTTSQVLQQEWLENNNE